MTSPNVHILLSTATLVLMGHVLMHPIVAYTIWPRGKEVFGDGRFLLLATIVLGGATASYLVSGGSVWAAMITHGLPVALWRDYFGGEEKLRQSGVHATKTDMFNIGKSKRQ